MPRYGLTGKMIAQPGQRDALVALLLEASRQVAEVPGCEVYIIAASPAEPDAIWITEVWASKDAHDASLAVPAVQATIARARPLIAGFGERFESVPLGGKGLA
ncbi:MAG TPA: putative quinol monooxygenase [Ktedonobacterales bacterium]